MTGPLWPELLAQAWAALTDGAFGPPGELEVRGDPGGLPLGQLDGRGFSWPERLSRYGGDQAAWAG